MTSGRSKERWFVPVKPTSRHNRGRAAAIAAVTVVTLAALCHLAAVPLVERLTPTSVEKTLPRARAGVLMGFFSPLIRFALDGYMDSRWLARAERAAVFVFARVPGLVLLLGAKEGWLVMPSYPVEGPLTAPILGLEVVLGVWILWGGFRPALGGA